MHSAVLTSATLTTTGSFAYVREALVLHADLDVQDRIFPSPFPYQRQAVLIVEDDPAANLTSADLPERQAVQLKRLADEFRSHPATVLLGVDTLRTGQAFPGNVLVWLAIAKLPFARQDPPHQARRRAAEQEGRDSFNAFYPREATLKFRQGFGRLIRSESDYDVIVVLDPGLPQRRYFPALLASLPPLRIVKARPDELANRVGHELSRLTSGQENSDRAGQLRISRETVEWQFVPSSPSPPAARPTRLAPLAEEPRL